MREEKAYTDQELIEGCRRGKRRCQELLYRRFYGFAMSVALRYSYSREDAQEILNDAFMKVFLNIGSFKRDGLFKSWFRKILVNTSIDHYRSIFKYRIQQDVDTGLEESLSVDDQVINKLSAQDILGLFNRLPYALRLTFNLYEVEGYSHDEIAALLGVSPGTSRSNLSRAKVALRRLYVQTHKEEGHEAV